MQHPRDPFSSDDSADDTVASGPADPDDPAPPPLPRRTSPTGHQPGGAFSRPHSSPQPPGDGQPGDGQPYPLPAPAAPPETHHAEAFADSGAGPEPELPIAADEDAFDAQALFESWEPPSDLADPRWNVPFQASAPDVELDRAPEYAGALAGPGGPPPGPGGPVPPGPRRPMAPPPHGPWSGPRHARHAHGRWGGVILALAGTLALAGAVPIGILGVRTLTQPPVPTVTTAPMADGHPISAPPSVAAAGPSQLSQGQTAVGPGTSKSSAPSHAAAPAPAKASTGAGGETTARAATFAVTAGPGCRSLSGVVTWPFHAPTGDGWHPATASRSGPCGTSFSYSLLANVKDDSGNWHDHYAWIFHTGKKVASCTLSVYVPPSPHASSTAFYWFSAGSDNPENRMADFTLDQQTSQGQWVTKGPFTFPGGTVLAEVTDRGVGPASVAVEASAVQLRCV
jgi:hypothetical protein